MGFGPEERVEPELEVEAVEPEEKTSLLKKEISFRRKAKEPKEKAPRRQKGAGRKRAKRLVGLKVGGSQLAAARVVNNGVPELVQVAREPLESGIIVGGELREPELLA